MAYASCGICGGRAWSPKNGDPPLCSACTKLHGTCCECGKPLTAGYNKNPDGKVICRACFFRYMEPRPCATCGTPSQRLSRSRKQGIEEPLCPACFKRRTRFYCPLCRHTRPPGGTDGQGRRICKTCTENGGPPSVTCAGCREVKPLYRRDRCFECYWLLLAEHKHERERTTIPEGWARETFDAFFRELVQAKWIHVNHKKVPYYAKFFAVLGTRIPDREQLTTDAVYALLGPNGVKDYAVPYRFMIRSGLLPEEGPEYRPHVVHLFKQQKVFDAAKGKWFEEGLKRYYQFLWVLQGRYEDAGHEGIRIAPGTITNNVRSAYALLDHKALADLVDFRQIDINHVTAFLGDNPRRKKGARTAAGKGKPENSRSRVIRPFIYYLNHVVKVFRPIRWKTKRVAPRKQNVISAAKRRDLIRKWTDPAAGNVRECLAGLFMLVYAQRMPRVAALRTVDFIERSDGTIFAFFGETPIPLPKKIEAVLRRHLLEREEILRKRGDTDNPYLFVGSLPNCPMAIEGIRHYRRDNGVTAPQLFASAMYYAFANGVKVPKTLAQAFGVSVATATNYYLMVNPRAREEATRRLTPRSTEPPEGASKETDDDRD